MIYEIHLYVPKTGELTPAMMEWLYEHGQESGQPEPFWPVRRIRPHALARRLMRLDATLVPLQGPGDDVELHYPNAELGIVLYLHDRGVILFFPYMAYSIYSRVVLGICYTYIRYLYEVAGFWSFDPQINRFASGDDFGALERTAVLMDQVMPKLLST
ncbi:MAG: hypothetical protein K8J31_10170 [Anaerolineae bacterium]|jgi:hypothetical protein|nr:hypothetical protein [Anaerolineae bacterium]